MHILGEIVSRTMGRGCHARWEKGVVRNGGKGAGQWGKGCRAMGKGCRAIGGKGVTEWAMGERASRDGAGDGGHVGTHGCMHAYAWKEGNEEASNASP